MTAEQQTEQTKDPLAELDENGDYPERWNPEVGDAIAGVVRRYSDVELQKSGLTRLCVVQTGPETVTTIFLSATVLKSEFKKLKPQIGEKIFVRFLGQPAGKDYKKYVVRLPDREAVANPDWDAYDDGRGGLPEPDYSATTAPLARGERAEARGGGPVNKASTEGASESDPFYDQ